MPLAASTDAPAANRAFATSLDLDFAILSDPDGRVARAYGVLWPLGLLAHRWTFYIRPDGRLGHVDRQVSPSRAGADAAERLRLICGM